MHAAAERIAHWLKRSQVVPIWSGYQFTQIVQGITKIMGLKEQAKNIADWVWFASGLEKTDTLWNGQTYEETVTAIETILQKGPQ